MTAPVIVWLLSAGLIVVVLVDTFETIILPRRVTRNVRLARLYFFASWRLWAAIGRAIPSTRLRDAVLGVYGPFSLLALLGIWGFGLIFGFAGMQWAFGSALNGRDQVPGFGTDVYFSGTTFLTLGLGDVVPRPGAPRVITVMEAALGFSFLALVISYLPVLYQAFSRREVSVSLLDARAGSPPTGVGMLLRSYAVGADGAMTQMLNEWEHWAAELLESHLSYPMLAYFRSQHESQSWVAALTAILDACALLLDSVEGPALQRQARMTFAIARHAAVDLSQILRVTPMEGYDRLTPGTLEEIERTLANHGLVLRESPEALRTFAELRRLYEPEVAALSTQLLMPLPPWMPDVNVLDDWETTAWQEPPIGRIMV